VTHLTTYSDASMSIAARICAESGKKNGIDRVWSWTDAAIRQTEFYEQNKAILDQPRGSGYWLWKPYIILDTLQRAKDGEIVVYADAGIEFIAPVKHITDRMDKDVWLFGNLYQHVHWCKADIIDRILGTGWVLDEKIKQVQASVILVRNTKAAREFITHWLIDCQEPGLIDDSPSKLPNHPEFREHRHDQAILTTWGYYYNMVLHWWPAIYNCGAFTYEKTGYNDTYPPLFHHHRCRNNEIEQPGMFRDYFHKKYPQIV
jgi:hypothetical protein